MKTDPINELSNETKEIVEETRSEFDGGWWNYRLVEKERRWTSKKTNIEYFEKYYEIHEVYYNGLGDIIAWTEHPMNLYFEQYSEIKQVIKQIKKATRKPILKLLKDGDREHLIPTNIKLKHIKFYDLTNFPAKEEYDDYDSETD